MLAGQIHGISRKWLWAVPFFQKVCRIVSSDGPGDIGRHFAEITKLNFHHEIMAWMMDRISKNIYRRTQESFKMDSRLLKIVLEQNEY